MHHIKSVSNIFIILRNKLFRRNQKIEKVFIIPVDQDNTDFALHNQSESMAVRYMNRFAIEEDDKFEIASVQTAEFFDEDDQLSKLDKAMQAVVKLTNQLTEG